MVFSSKIKLAIIAGVISFIVLLGGAATFLFYQVKGEVERAAKSEVASVINEEELDSLRERLNTQEELNEQFEKELSRLRRETQQYLRVLNSPEFLSLMQNDPVEAQRAVNQRIEEYFTSIQEIADDIAGVQNEDEE